MSAEGFVVFHVSWIFSLRSNSQLLIIYMNYCAAAAASSCSPAGAAWGPFQQHSYSSAQTLKRCKTNTFKGFYNQVFWV